MNNPTIITRWQQWAPEFRSLLRIVAAILFIQNGTMKLLGWPISMPPAMLPLHPFSQIWFAGVLELFGGGLILLGLFTRPVAFILSGEMAVAYFQGHASNGLWTLANGGTDAVFFCFFFLYLSSAGAGPWSLDAWWSRLVRKA